MGEPGETSNQQEHGSKVGNVKRKGKLTELDRLKKRQKELQIMKMSQEWDARRHKRRMDRIQWLQQRKNHVPPSTERDQNTVNTVEDSRNEYLDSNVVLSKTNNSPVSTHSSSEIFSEGLREIEVQSEENDRIEDEAYGKRKFCEEDDYYSAEESHCTACESNEEYKSVVVKTERLDSDSFCNSNESKQPIQSYSKNSYHTNVESDKKARKEDNQVFLSKTNENQSTHASTLPNESNRGSPYQRLVTMVNAHPPVIEERFLNTTVYPLGNEERYSNSSVIVQAMKQSGLDENEIDDPNLLMASEPVRFEDVLRKGGTCIQRLETRTVEIMSKQPQGRMQEKLDKAPVPRPHSRESPSTEDQKRIRKVENEHKNQAFPKIKQCYSLIGQDNKSSRTSPLSSSRSTGSPIATMASSSSDVFTDKNERRLQPVAQSPSTSSQPCPPSGYLVPIYKPSADEVVYAFVANAGDRGLPRAPDPGKVCTDAGCYRTETDPKNAVQVGYSSVRAPTTTIHHGRDPLPRVGQTLQLKEAHHPTNVTWVNTPIASTGEKRNFVNNNQPVSGITLKSPAHEQVKTSGNSQRRNDKHLHRETEMIIKTRHNPSPVVTNINGYSSVHTAHASQTANKSPVLRANSIDNASNDPINNPTAIYVRPKLVPREIVVPHHTGSGNVPIVEYIKTDAICDKDLGSWTAKNVADFISATDCSESAKIFIEQDIDGKAVLLLSQNLFINRLNLKLGTAIKLYNHIANLRTALLM
ncbi:uncharacterized protein LOC116295329 [Actinia tenebrosa]|uniref:Uncharacterized protein LOC116295329 n=1 Tax=Actinia tenebrosa TaxID=6105 RepID=A0A6P8HUD0_ACTTE|nr:uncharacterized protein LOC116295329 [Actinia tenebrosa]